jgi:hypothetical protein
VTSFIFGVSDSAVDSPEQVTSSPTDGEGVAMAPDGRSDLALFAACSDFGYKW